MQPVGNVQPAEQSANQIEALVEAARRYAPVLELLTIVRELRDGQELDDPKEKLLQLACVAALLARAEEIHSAAPKAGERQA